MRPILLLALLGCTGAPVDASPDATLPELAPTFSVRMSADLEVQLPDGTWQVAAFADDTAYTEEQLTLGGSVAVPVTERDGAGRTMRVELRWSR